MTTPRWILCVLAVLAVGCGKKDAEPQKKKASGPAAKAAPAAIVFDESMWEFFKELPAQFEAEHNPITDDKIALGRLLYFDARLSKNHDVSCNSCHGLDTFGVDNRKFSPGHKQQLGGRNSPTVYNAGGYIAQFWDGRSETLEDQAKGPVLNPVEMAMPDEQRVVETMASIPEYVEAFAKAFPGDEKPVTFDNMAKAIGAFERKLVTKDRFDMYLAGDKGALTDNEQRGLFEFHKLGCTTCHYGSALGGSSFEKLGSVKPYPDQSDLGRYEITKLEADKMKFRVPTLRNVAKTAPYFHNGSIDGLAEVVEKMAWHQAGTKVTPEQVEVIVAFLGSLSGELPTEYIAKPELPASTKKTPKPDPS